MAGTINCSFQVHCEQDNVSYIANPTTVSYHPNAEYIHENFPIMVTKYTVLILLVLFGVIGNVIVVIVTSKRKTFNSSLDLFVKNLAIADLGFLLLVIPVGVIRAEFPFKWPMGKYFCLYVFPILDLFYGASVWTIAAIAFERYRNIVRLARVSRRETYTKRSAKILVFIVWSFSFIFFCIPIYVSTIYVENPSSCTTKWATDPEDELVALKIYLAFLVILPYFLPLGVVIWTYIVISRQLSMSSTFLKGIKVVISRKNAKNRRQVETENNHEDQAALKGISNGSFQHSQRYPLDCSRLAQNRRAKNILTPVAVLFAVSMFPISILRIVLMFSPKFYSQPYYFIVLFICIIFTASNSSLNPLVYCIVSREFRSAFRSIFSKTNRGHLRNSHCGLDPRESSKRRTMELSCSHMGNGSDEPPPENKNSSRLFLACNTKL